MKEPASPSDMRVARARHGDVVAFTSLLKDHDGAMRALVWSMVRDQWVMDDILQSAYEKAFRSVRGFRGESSFGTWLHRICWTTAVDAIRHQARRAHDDIDERSQFSVSGAGASTGVIERISLDGAMARLPQAQRTALMLVAVQGMSYAEAAAVCGTNQGTIASRVARGRERLRVLLGSDYQEGGRS